MQNLLHPLSVASLSYWDTRIALSIDRLIGYFHFIAIELEADKTVQPHVNH